MTYAAGAHTITLTNAGSAGELFYFDFVEAAVPTTTLPTFSNEPRMTLATDWDTKHSLALAPERTAWLIDTLGFAARCESLRGRAVVLRIGEFGATYMRSATVTFTGGPDTDPAVTYSVTLTGSGRGRLTKLIHMGDTAETLALAYANELNNGYMSFWASASGNVLTITARTMGTAGNFDIGDGVDIGSEHRGR